MNLIIGCSILMEEVLKLQKHCQLFLPCLFSEGGPTKLGEFTAEKLCQALVKEVN